MSVLVGAEWVEAAAGSFVLVPGNMTHDFENRSPERAGMLNVSAPGNFEQRMPGIAQWFTERSPAESHAWSSDDCSRSAHRRLTCIDSRAEPATLDYERMGGVRPENTLFWPAGAGRQRRPSPAGQDPGGRSGLPGMGTRPAPLPEDFPEETGRSY
jgi:hypothetical protein